MKIRAGFVSNSSSSSFIIGAAKVLDEKKLQEHMDTESHLILTGKGFKMYALTEDTFAVYEESVIIKAPTNKEERCWVHVKDDDKYLIVRVGHDEGDSMFYKDDYFDGLDYSIVNEDYFKQNFPLSYKALKALQGIEGVTEPVRYLYGVSRSG